MVAIEMCQRASPATGAPVGPTSLRPSGARNRATNGAGSAGGQVSSPQSSIGHPPEGGGKGGKLQVGRFVFREAKRGGFDAVHLLSAYKCRFRCCLPFGSIRHCNLCYGRFYFYCSAVKFSRARRRGIGWDSSVVGVKRLTRFGRCGNRPTGGDKNVGRSSVPFPTQSGAPLYKRTVLRDFVQRDGASARWIDRTTLHSITRAAVSDAMFRPLHTLL